MEETKECSLHGSGNAKSSRRVKGGQGRAVEGLVSLATEAGFASYARVLSHGSNRMPWGAKKAQR